MAVPESQLETWSSQGSISQSATTYGTVKATIDDPDTPFSKKEVTVFLQGSYGNDTNIYSESDVDIIALMNRCFQSDLSALPPEQASAYEEAYGNASYTHADFKRDLVALLRTTYGSAVAAGDKAITIAANGYRRKADVIAAIQFRRYYRFNGIEDESFDTGICFYNAAGNRIANYPKQHSTNLTAKHQRTNGWYKPTVRFFKNLRERLLTEGMIEAGVAPSYYLEGLLYNVPDSYFDGSYKEIFENSLNWLETADKTKLVCANEQYYLLRDETHTCWPPANCKIFLEFAATLWREWYD